MLKVLEYFHHYYIPIWQKYLHRILEDIHFIWHRHNRLINVAGQLLDWKFLLVWKGLSSGNRFSYQFVELKSWLGKNKLVFFECETSQKKRHFWFLWRFLRSFMIPIAFSQPWLKWKTPKTQHSEVSFSNSDGLVYFLHYFIARRLTWAHR